MSELLGGAAKRDVHVFTVPKNVLKDAGEAVTKVGLVLLTLGEEKLAADRGITPHGVAMQSVFLSLRQVNGKPVSVADGTAEEAYGKMHPKVRALCSNAVQLLHGIVQGDADSFMASREVVSG